MNELFDRLIAAIDYFMATDLPQHTAEALVSVIKHSAALLSVLLDEYMAVLFK